MVTAADSLRFEVIRLQFTTDRFMSKVLSQLRRGEVGKVTAVGPEISDEFSLHLFRRLAELGFIPGETVKVLRKSFGGEPIAVRIGNSTFALRKYEADQIHIEPTKAQ